LGATSAESWLMWALTTPQAAATLAATTVGFQIGLFDESIVNAVLVLILVSMIVSTLVAERTVGRVQLPAEAAPALGERVLVAVADLDAAPLGLRVARALAGAHAGVIEVVLIEPAGSDAATRRADMDRLDGLCHRLGIDTEPALRVTDHRARSTMLAASDFLASLVFAVGPADDHWAETVDLHERAPVSIVQGTLDRPLTAIECVATAPASNAAGAVASELISVMPIDVSIDHTDSDTLISRLEPGQLAITAVANWDRLTAVQAPTGAALLLIPEALVLQTLNARDTDRAVRT
jgi:hypothetical protein